MGVWVRSSWNQEVSPEWLNDRWSKVTRQLMSRMASPKGVPQLHEGNLRPPKPVALCGWMPWSWHRDSGSVSKGKSPAAQMGLWYRYQYQQKKDLKQRLTVKEGEDQTFQQVKSVDVIHKSWAAFYGLKGFSFWSWYKKLLSNLKSPPIVSNPLIYLDGNSMQLF